MCLSNCCLDSFSNCASNERTFSKLKLIKTHLRPTIGDERLHSGADLEGGTAGSCPPLKFQNVKKRPII